MIPVCGPLTLAVFFALSIEVPLFVSLTDMRAKTPTESALGGACKAGLAGRKSNSRAHCRRDGPQNYSSGIGPHLDLDDVSWNRCST